MTVVGVGLLGASLAKACKERGLVEEIVGHGRNRENLEKAKSLKIIDHYCADLSEAVNDADLIVLCTPVSTIVPLIKNMISEIRPGTLITDVGSVKDPVVSEADKLIPDGNFVGSHPIAGGENSGLEASTADLYQDAKCIVTPTEATNKTALEKINALWQAVGMNVIRLSAEEHDFIFGAVSHLPHIVAYALMNTLGALRTKDDREVTAFSGAGLKDITRIASSDPVMWRDICLSNRKHSLDLIDLFQIKLDEIRSIIEKGDGQTLKNEFIAANNYRLKVI
ncbi:MAG: prephenate dehydrogenase/arogenate dehydrogenase family protein [Nitrospina sp.]|nr:prephenate dehydrogenase/arogenate dehydrogenase family protein [Nitrospina sp.]MBT3508578.1 prephenate dehydrogenase/arogenate dehydrogenase family protein [Nitrospina sp.]MBT3875354.1 prephenate dehydrogenase/arogenate dehydrogenase family protein [Nitrospina sp.]MBT4048561.1 prephenate dehydrogenase/arogenate dehydrogenase family protein [Nitrospina sp.]MBT4558989.1 prephenate dehydrogenase/arogenate dehydrogenase family protein [Nitrospina sp.]